MQLSNPDSHPNRNLAHPPALSGPGRADSSANQQVRAVDEQPWRFDAAQSLRSAPTRRSLRPVTSARIERNGSSAATNVCATDGAVRRPGQTPGTARRPFFRLNPIAEEGANNNPLISRMNGTWILVPTLCVGTVAVPLRGVFVLGAGSCSGPVPDAKPTRSWTRRPS